MSSCLLVVHPRLHTLTDATADLARSESEEEEEEYKEDTPSSQGSEFGEEEKKMVKTGQSRSLVYFRVGAIASARAPLSSLCLDTGS